MFSGSDGATYSFTDGYCLATLPNAHVGVYLQEPHIERTWPAGKGPGVADGSGRVVGHAVWYAEDGSDRHALIRLDRGTPFETAVCTYGSARTIDTSISDLPTEVSLYGQGGRDTGTRARIDVLPHGPYDPAIVQAARQTEFGDTGAPVLIGDNQAFGILAGRANGAGDPTHPFPGPPVYRLTPLMKRAGATLHLTLTLAKRPGRAR